MSKKTWSMVLPLALCGVLLGAQEKEKVERARTPAVPVKLQVVFSRYQGEKKVSNLPYTLSLNADDHPAKLRIGIQVPIQTIVQGTATMTYKDVSNNVDCRVKPGDDGRFEVGCSLEQTSLYSSGAGTEPSVANTPVLRTFRTEASLSLRDGQTSQYTVATDPVSGETLKIDVTLSVVK